MNVSEIKKVFMKSIVKHGVLNFERGSHSQKWSKLLGNELIPSWNQGPYSARFRQEMHPQQGQAAFGIDYHWSDLS